MARVINVDSVGAKMFIHSYNAGDGMMKITNKLMASGSPAGAAFRQPSTIGTCLFSLCDHSSTKAGEIKKPNGLNRGPGTNCISNKIVLIVSFSIAETMCAEYLQKRGCVRTVVIKAEHTYCKLSFIPDDPAT